MNYRHRVDISDIHQGYRDGTIEATNIGTMVADRLEKTLLPEVGSARRRGLKDIIAHLRKCQDIEEYDCCLENLYDWADKMMLDGRLCWVNTFPKAASL